MAATAGIVNRDGELNDGPFSGVIAEATPVSREIAIALRQLVYDILPETVEVVWPTQGSVGWGVGPKKFSEQFAYMMCAARHVTLGFYRGGELADPAQMLPKSEKTQVSGKLSMRSLKLTSLEDVRRPELRDLIDEATRTGIPAV